LLKYIMDIRLDKKKVRTTTGEGVRRVLYKTVKIHSYQAKAQGPKAAGYAAVKRRR